MISETKGSWSVSNLRGISKKFKDIRSPEANAWMVDRSDPEADRAAALKLKEEAKAAKALEKAAAKAEAKRIKDEGKKIAGS